MPLCARVLSGSRVVVDLQSQTVMGPGEETHEFPIVPFPKHCLLDGLGELGCTISEAERSADFERRHEHEDTGAAALVGRPPHASTRGRSMPRIGNPKDFYAGLLFVAIGLADLVLVRAYPLGTSSRMGPGYFPRILGFLLVGLGALLSVRGFRSGGEAITRWHWRPLSIVLLSVLIWGLTAQRLGLLVASLALVFVSSVASDEFEWKEALLSGAIQAAAMAVLFIYGLGIPLPVWPVFLGGR